MTVQHQLPAGGQEGAFNGCLSLGERCGEKTELALCKGISDE